MAKASHEEDMHVPCVPTPVYLPLFLHRPLPLVSFLYILPSRLLSPLIRRLMADHESFQTLPDRNERQAFSCAFLP